MGRCQLWSDIPFNFAKKQFYVSMFKAVAIVDSTYKPATCEELRGPILQNEKVDALAGCRSFEIHVSSQDTL